MHHIVTHHHRPCRETRLSPSDGPCPSSGPSPGRAERSLDPSSLCLSGEARLWLHLQRMMSVVRGLPLDHGAERLEPGQARELKAGQTQRGPHGSLVTWGRDQTVRIRYRGKDGRSHQIEVKGDRMTIDGGPPRKLANRGQILKLPNGDVVGIGNSVTPGGGKQLGRVALADSVDGIPTNPPGKTNVYDLSRCSTGSNTSAAVLELNLNVGRFCSSGMVGHLNATFLGVAGTGLESGHLLRWVGVK